MQSLTKIIVLAALAGVLTFGALSVAILEPKSAELERIQEKWPPVFRPNARQNKDLERIQEKHAPVKAGVGTGVKRHPRFLPLPQCRSRRLRARPEYTG